MNDNFNSSTRHPPRQLSIALVVLEGFDFASLSATLEAISTAKRRLGAGVVSCTTLGTSSSPMSSSGISVTPNSKLGDAQLSEYDVIVLIGGSEATLKTHQALTQQLQSAAKAGRLLGGIWNGAYHLAAAGLTDSYECLITGDGRFSIEPPMPKHRRYATWQFDERRMSCRDAYSATRMMEAMFDHFFGASTATANVAKGKAKSQQASGTDFLPKAC
ncbi:DJ-1/PfpI family protein [Pseudomonas sp. NPDC090233]|uniref:DJ-1/PfpI family protein n=1 Tax=Pseudomonas sp. NPDC090233 TaxID=3364479 RepID=UPI003839F6CD